MAVTRAQTPAPPAEQQRGPGTARTQIITATSPPAAKPRGVGTQPTPNPNFKKFNTGIDGS